MKYIFLGSVLFLSINTSYANKKASPNSFSFISKPANPNGNFVLSCFYPNGSPIQALTDIKVKEVKEDVNNYKLITSQNKIIYAPVSSCYIIEN